MAIAQGISKKTVYKKQTGLGAAASGSGGQVLRREQSVFTLGKGTYTNNEIVSHQQSTGITHGLRKPTGKISGVLSPGTYSALLGSLLRADFAAVSAISGLTLTIAAGAGSSWTLTRSTGSYLTGGVKIGDVVRLSGAVNPANNAKNLFVIAVTATILTVLVVNGTALTAEANSASVTVTVTGKKSKAPTTGHTNDYYTFEEWYSDIAQSEKYTDAQIAKADIGLPSTGNSTIAIDVVALNRTTGATQILTAPTAETSTGVLQAVNGVLILNGASVANITSAQVAVDGQVTPLGAVVGANVSPDTQRGRINVSGQITAYFQDATISALYENATSFAIALVVAADNTASSDFVALSMSNVLLSSDIPDDGEKGIVRTFQFTAAYNGAGGAALANDATILTIQDSAA